MTPAMEAAMPGFKNKKEEAQKNGSKRRAASLEEMQATIGRLFETLRAEPPVLSLRPDDVVISPYGKCGTTWLQQIFHTLRSGGDMDFDDISRVVPWIETSPGLGLPLETEQVANPRGFKSHLSWDEVPKGGRYIVSFRHPEDAAVSLYKFFEGWFFEPGAVSLEEFVTDFYVADSPGTSYWQHLVSWWEQRESNTVLLLCFEDLKENPEYWVERIAAFCHIPMDSRLKELTLAQSSFEFMKAHRRKFDDLLMRKASERICDLPIGSDSAKVREGEVGSNRLQLSETARAALAKAWRDQVEALIGFPDYESFRQAVNELQE